MKWKNRIKKLLFGVTIWGVVSLFPLNVFATQSHTENFDKSYSLGNDQIENLVNIAQKQLGKRKADLGYTEAWCADFVCDCAKLTGMADNIIPYNYGARGVCTSLYNYMLNNCSARSVSSREKGDIIFYYCSSCGRYVHTGIVLDGTYSIEGNYDHKVTKVKNSYTDSAGHTLASGTIARKYLRPNYSSVEKPVDVGTNFYAYLINTATWLHATNDDSGNVSVRKLQSASNQTWYFERQGDGSYKITSCKDGRCMEVHNFESANGTNVEMNDWNGNTAQRWFIYGSSGEYKLKAVCGNNALDVSGGTGAAQDGTNLNMWEDNGTDAQKFSIWKLDSDLGTTEASIEKYNDADGNNVKISWNSCHNATGYDIRIFNESETEVVQTFWNVQGTSCLAKLESGTYHVKVYTLNSQFNIWKVGEARSFTCSNDRGSEMTSGYDRVLPDGDYIIANAANPQYYLDIEGSDLPAASGTNVSLCGPFSGDLPAYDVWTIKYSDGFYRISQKDTDISLDVYNIETLQESNIQVWMNNDTSAQKWAISENGKNGYRLQAKCSGYSLDIAGGDISSGVNVRQYSGNDTAAQEWIFIPYKPSQDIPDGRYVLLTDLDRTMELDVEGDTGDIPNGTNVQIWKDTAPSQYNSFDITKLDNGYYKIIHAASGKALNLQDGVPALEGNISLYDDNGSLAQQWAITSAGGDSFVLWSRCSGMAMDVKYLQTANGTNVFQYTYNGKANQRWHFVKAEYNVTYNAMGGEGKPADQIKYYKSDLKLNSSVPTRTGYIFKGWNSSSDLKRTSYLPGSTYAGDEDMTLYAVWEKDPVPVISVTKKGGILTATVSNMDPVKEYGFVCGKENDVTLKTPGRTRVAYSKADADSSYSFDASELTGCTIRAYAVYTDVDGKEQIIYSESIVQ